jgi:hypothetical protein
MLDAADGERVEALAPQLDDHAVGVRLRLGYDPGERHDHDPREDVSAGGWRNQPEGAAVTQL